MGMFAQWVPLTFPYVPGYDVAGSIESATSFAAGARVLAMLDNRKGGGYAGFAVVAEEAIALLPDGLDFERAATLPTAGLTGVQVINEHVVPRNGDRILITGATGAVGRFALHAAKAAGAYVIAAVREGQRSLALPSGADEVLVLGEALSEQSAWDHVVDTVGGAAVTPLCRNLRPGGKIKTLATTPIPSGGLSSLPEFITVHTDAVQLAGIARTVADGKISIPIAFRLPLADARKAHCLMEAGGVGGKIILEH
jgi:NADPH:quinone reductase-like Zn-dependent oxidoreductase